MTLFYGAGGFGLGFYDGPEPILTFDELTTYYINLLIMQYYNKAKARQTVGVFVQEMVASRIIEQVQDGFNLETAVGNQLDFLAEYRGANRTVFGLDLTRDYFHMPLYDDPDPEDGFGFALYGEIVTWYWILYADANRPIYSMTDDELRRLLMFRARTQSRFLSISEIDDILFEFFEDRVHLTDNGDMTITYTHDVGDPDTLFTVVQGTNSLPRPAGVEAIVA